MSMEVALARNGGPKPLPDVPAFLNKLYTMIDDPTTDDIIKWADDGESFYIFSQDELQKKVLPAWFKHNKFSSFVRQLNMYGFHKMQQMRQGALKNASEAEIWQFQEPNFRRGRLDLLKTINRKKGSSMNQLSAKSDPDADFDDPEVVTPSNNGNSAPPSRGTAGPVAIQSLAGELTIIKRNQNTILSDLKALQLSNNQLWKETMASQEVQKKQQDTIDRIVKFLAGVFGNAATSPRGGPRRDMHSNDARSSTGSPSPRQHGMLLLDDGTKRSKGRSTDLVRRPTNTIPQNKYTPYQYPEQSGTNGQTPLEERGPRIEEIDSTVTTPTAPMMASTSSSNGPIAKRLGTVYPTGAPANGTDANAPSSMGKSSKTASSDPPAPNSPFNLGLNLSDGPLQSALAEYLRNPSDLMNTISQLQQQQNVQQFTDPGPSNQAASSVDPSSSSSQLQYPPAYNPNPYAPNDPSLASFLAPNEVPNNTVWSPSSLNTQLNNNALYVPYDNNNSFAAALADTADGIDTTYDGIHDLHGNVENIEALMRDLLRANPNIFQGAGGEGTARLEDVGDGDFDDLEGRASSNDNSMVDDIGLPTVDSAVANANASGVPVGGTPTGANLAAADFDSFFNSFHHDNAPASTTLDIPSVYSGNPTTVLPLDPRHAVFEAGSDDEGHGTSFEPAHPLNTAYHAPVAGMPVADGKLKRGKRKSDAALDADLLGLSYPSKDGESPPTKKLRARKKQK